EASPAPSCGRGPRCCAAPDTRSPGASGRRRPRWTTPSARWVRSKEVRPSRRSLPRNLRRRDPQIARGALGRKVFGEPTGLVEGLLARRRLDEHAGEALMGLRPRIAQQALEWGRGRLERDAGLEERVPPRGLPERLLGKRPVAAEEVQVPGQEAQDARAALLVVAEVLAQELDETPEDGEALLGRGQPAPSLADLPEEPGLDERAPRQHHRTDAGARHPVARFEVREDVAVADDGDAPRGGHRPDPLPLPGPPVPLLPGTAVDRNLRPS